MAALDFPASPTVNQTYTANNITYKWDGTSWLTYNPLDLTYVTGTLATSNGGTGTTTSTGSGSNVLSTSPSLTTPALNGETYSSSNITAGTNAQGQGAFTTDNAIVTSTPNNPSGVTLPTAVTGRCVVVANRGTNPVSIFPASGGQIDSLGANAAITLPAGQWMEFNSATGTQWYSTANATINTTSLVGTVAVANGGTGVTTSTGSGSNVLSTSPTLVTPILGTPTSGNFSTGTFTWPTFNQNTTGSAATLTTGRTLAITGDLTWTSPAFNGSANVTAAGTLATVNSNVGSFGSSTSIPVITVNAKGLVTAVSTATVAGGQYFGTAATKAIAYNSATIGENITVTAGNNGLSAGPITVSTGFTVTIETGATWSIV